MSVAWPWKPEETWWIRIFALGSAMRLPFGAAGQQQRAHRHRDADADRLHVGLDELHRVVDRQARVHRAAGRVDVDRDVLVGILGLEVQQLRDDQVRDLVVDRRAEEDDPLVEQAGVDVERALPARGLLDDHRYEWAHGPRFVSLRAVGFLSSRRCRAATRASLATAARRPGSPADRAGDSGLRRRLRARPRLGRPQRLARLGLLDGDRLRALGEQRRPPGARRGRRLSASRRPAERSRSSSFFGLTPSRSAACSSASRTSLLGRLDLLGLDDRGEHGLALERLLGVGLGLARRSRSSARPAIRR